MDNKQDYDKDGIPDVKDKESDGLPQSKKWSRGGIYGDGIPEEYDEIIIPSSGIPKSESEEGAAGNITPTPEEDDDDDWYVAPTPSSDDNDTEEDDPPQPPRPDTPAPTNPKETGKLHAFDPGYVAEWPADKIERYLTTNPNLNHTEFNYLYNLLWKLYEKRSRALKPHQRAGKLFTGQDGRISITGLPFITGRNPHNPHRPEFNFKSQPLLDDMEMELLIQEYENEELKQYRSVYKPSEQEITELAIASERARRQRARDLPALRKQLDLDPEYDDVVYTRKDLDVIKKQMIRRQQEETRRQEAYKAANIQPEPSTSSSSSTVTRRRSKFALKMTKNREQKNPEKIPLLPKVHKPYTKPSTVPATPSTSHVDNDPNKKQRRGGEVPASTKQLQGAGLLGFGTILNQEVSDWVSWFIDNKWWIANRNWVTRGNSDTQHEVWWRGYGYQSNAQDIQRFLMMTPANRDMYYHTWWPVNDSSYPYNRHYKRLQRIISGKESPLPWYRSQPTTQVYREDNIRRGGKPYYE